jgi:hypothetical protein
MMGPPTEATLGDQMANPFPSTEPAWGLRAYLILIGCAADRQTVTYDALARRIKRGGPNLLAKPLALITQWCQHHSLPALASLVVEQATGLPAPGFAAVSKDEIPREQERVWAFDWYAIFPPTIEELVETPMQLDIGPNDKVRSAAPKSTRTAER